MKDMINKSIRILLLTAIFNISLEAKAMVKPFFNLEEVIVYLDKIAYQVDHVDKSELKETLAILEKAAFPIKDFLEFRKKANEVQESGNKKDIKLFLEQSNEVLIFEQIPFETGEGQIIYQSRINILNGLFRLKDLSSTSIAPLLRKPAKAK